MSKNKVGFVLLQEMTKHEEGDDLKRFLPSDIEFS